MFRFPYPAIPVYKSHHAKETNDKNRKVDDSNSSLGQMKSKNDSKLFVKDSLDNNEKLTDEEVRFIRVQGFVSILDNLSKCVVIFKLN